MLRLLANLIAKVFRHRDIVIDNELYLRRVYLTPRRIPLTDKHMPLFVFLHFIFRGDEGRWLHDHPWNFWSFTLWGKYSEKIMLPKGEDRIGERHHGRFAWIRYPAEHRHRVLVEKPVVTLCFVRPPCREWGFFPHDDDRWVHWREHLGLTEEMQPGSFEDTVRA